MPIQPLDYLALFSAIIAISALIISLYSLWETKKINIINLKPVLDDSLIFNDQSERIGLFLENRGLGPAVVISWKMLVDGKHYKELGIDRFEDLTNFLEIPEAILYGFFKPGAMIIQGSPQDMFSVPAEPYSIERSDLIRNALKRIEISITYKSILEGENIEVYLFEGHKRFEKDFGLKTMLNSVTGIDVKG